MRAGGWAEPDTSRAAPWQRGGGGRQALGEGGTLHSGRGWVDLFPLIFSTSNWEKGSQVKIKPYSEEFQRITFCRFFRL